MPFSPTPFQVSFLLMASIHSLAFHVLFGKATLVVTWVAAAAGFLAGQFVADRLVSQGMIMLGSVYVLETSLGAWLALILAHKLGK